MKRLSAYLFFLVLSFPVYALELGVFELSAVRPLRGLIEPASNSIPGAQARILLFPEFTVFSRSVDVWDANGIKVTTMNIDSAQAPFRGAIHARISRSSPTDDEKLLILHEAYPELDTPPLERDKPLLPKPTGNMGADSLAGQIYAGETRKWESRHWPYNDKLRAHQFLPTMPKNIEITAKFGEDIVAKYLSPKDARSISGVISIPLVGNLTLATMRPLLSDEFTLEVAFTITETNFTSLAATYNFTHVIQTVTEAFRNEITTSSTSTTGFLFWETTSKRLATAVNESASKSTQNRSSALVEIRNYDTTDQNVIALMEKFLFPQISIEDAIRSHQAAALQAEKTGNANLAKLHRKYIESLTNAGSGGLGDGFDSYVALASLVDGDLLTFLSSGIAFKETSGGSSLKIRRMAASSATDAQFRSFSSSLFRSIDQYYVVNIEPPNLRRENIGNAGFNFSKGE